MLTVNIGTVTSTYRVQVKRLSQGAGRVVPPAWITFAHNDVTLAARHRVLIGVTLSVPSSAAGGRYLSGDAPAIHRQGLGRRRHRQLGMARARRRAARVQRRRAG